MGRFRLAFVVCMAVLLLAFLGACRAYSPERSIGAPSPEQVSALDVSLVLISGEEDTAGLHIIALNIDTPINETKADQERIDDINAQGGIAIIAHPGPEHEELLKTLHGYAGLELMPSYSGGPPIYSEPWDAVLADRVRRGMPLVWGFRSDDSHGPPYRPDDTFIMVQARERTKEGIVASIQQGSFYGTLGGALIKNIVLSGNTISVSLPSEMEIAFIKEGGEIIKTVTGISGQYEVRGDEGYVRVEVRSSGGAIMRIAWTQPFRVIGPGSIENPYAAGGDWYKGNIHCHTTESDGALSPGGVIWCYQAGGYDFLAITDHNTITTFP